MQLSDIHADPRLLADFLCVPFEPETRSESTWYSRRSTNTVTFTAEERTATAFAEYRSRLNAEWNKSAANPWKGQTWAQFVAECISKTMGIRKGKVVERIAAAVALRPDLYAAPISA